MNEVRILDKLRKRARRLGLYIRKDRTTGYYYLVNAKINAVWSPFLDFEELEEYIQHKRESEGETG